MIRRLLAAALLATSAIAGASSITAPASADAGTCVWRLYGIPANYRIGVDRPLVIPGGDCEYADNWSLFASVHHSDGQHQYVSGTALFFTGCSYSWVDNYNPPYDCISIDGTGEYSPAGSQRINITTPGNMTTTYSIGLAQDFPGDSYDTYTDQLVTQRFTAKYAARVGLATSRTAGNRVTLTMTPTQYSVPAGRFVPITRTYVQVQRYVNGTWTRLVSVRSVTGTITYSFYTATKYQYRVYLPATSTRWAAVTATRTT